MIAAVAQNRVLIAPLLGMGMTRSRLIHSVRQYQRLE